MQSDDSMRQDGKTTARQSWSHITALSSLRKTDYCPSRRDMDCANQMIRRWTIENPNASEIEKLNFFRVVLLTSQLRAAANRHMLMSGQTIEDGNMTREDFEKRKSDERKLVPSLDKQLADALRATGETRQQKKISDDIATSAEAAAMVYQKYRVVGGDSE